MVWISDRLKFVEDSEVKAFEDFHICSRPVLHFCTVFIFLWNVIQSVYLTNRSWIQRTTKLCKYILNIKQRDTTRIIFSGRSLMITSMFSCSYLPYFTGYVQTFTRLQRNYVPAHSLSSLSDSEQRRRCTCNNCVSIIGERMDGEGKGVWMWHRKSR